MSKQQRQHIIFDDTFLVKTVDREGNHFDKVSRIDAKTDEEETELILDYNTDIYSLKANDRFALVLATSLDNETDDGLFKQNVNGTGTLLDKYEYCMSGKVFRLNKTATKGELFVSFGGLLMCLKGDVATFQKFTLDSLIYLLIRKVH